MDGGRKKARGIWTRKWLRWWWCTVLGAVALFAGARPAAAQEPPYFVTYSQALEEPGNLEVEFKGTAASPKNANAFGGGTLELEYGAKAWWTTELYLRWADDAGGSTLFTGFRWENRFRPLPGEHWINPVAYVEYEDVNHADRSFLEVVGNDSVQDLLLTNAQGRSDVERELELKAILSSHAKGWNFSENFINEKNLSAGEPWEFGYAVGASRPLALLAGAKPCIFCREHFAAGAEIYGGLGTTNSSACARPRTMWGRRWVGLAEGPDAALLAQLWTERQQHGRAVARFGLLRDSAGIPRLAPWRKGAAVMRRRGWFVARWPGRGMAAGAEVNQDWLQKVPAQGADARKSVCGKPRSHRGRASAV